MEAVREVTGRESTTDGIPVQGMLDPVILTRMMENAGLAAEAIRAAMPRVIEVAQEVYRSGVPDLRDRMCPGVVPLLEQFTAQGRVLALVTGNLTRIGWHKLERAGIHHYFRFGSFGEMAATRGELARLAIARARREGMIAAEDRVALIGDAPQDIEAAREAGALAIAVRTGISSAGTLEALGPDVLIDDLTCLDTAVL